MGDELDLDLDLVTTHMLELSLSVRVKYDEELLKASECNRSELEDLIRTLRKICIDFSLYSKDLMFDRDFPLQDVSTNPSLENLLLRKVLQERERCSVCQSRPFDIVVTSCGHIFCLACIREWIKRKENTVCKCPNCNTELRMKDLFLERRRTTKVEALIENLLQEDKHTGKSVVLSHFVDALAFIKDLLKHYGLRTICCYHIPSDDVLDTFIDLEARGGVLLIDLRTAMNFFSFFDTECSMYFIEACAKCVIKYLISRAKKKPSCVSRFIYEDTIETKIMALKGEACDRKGIYYSVTSSDDMVRGFLQPPLDLLLSYLPQIRIRKVHNGIFKQECCLSFDTPKSEGGLFMDLYTFLAFGKDYVCWNYEKTGHAIYLHIKQTRQTRLVPKGRPSKKPKKPKQTKMVLEGVDGGFGNDDPEYKETLRIVILPEYFSLPFSDMKLLEKARLAIGAILLADGADRMAALKDWKDEFMALKEQLAAWMADKKQASANTMDIQQIGNGVVIPPSGWKCAKCDRKDNLWLNLTDGTILCGSKNRDESGGNNHAFEYYKETGYPFYVNLATIAADPKEADVFSYLKNECVLDPDLAKHLAFFGIDFSSLQKTETRTAIRELDQNTNFDGNRIQESGNGYTGLVNIGNNCYMAATMQVVFSTRSFISRYYLNQSLKKAFELSLDDPTVDLNMQLTKLAHGLLSGKYSVPAFQKQEGIPPSMFKAVIAASHSGFSSTQQQDALEFFQHFLDQVERANTGKTEPDPARSFKFGIEYRTVCSSGKVTYGRGDDCILSLNIPLLEATNKEELEPFHKVKAEKHAEGKAIAAGEIVRPRVPLEACLKKFFAPEDIYDCYSTALKTKTTVQKTRTAWLTSFPDYLVLHMQRFFMEDTVPEKLDVYIDVPDTIDISHFRSKGKGQQDGEELLADGVISDATSHATSIPNDVDLPDEEGRYRLIGFVNHIGTSTQCGHYVAHVLKDDRWVVFDDNKVEASVNPPKEMGYMYFFERLDVLR